MNVAIPPFPQYAFMAWCLVKAQGQLYLYLYLRCLLVRMGEFPLDIVHSLDNAYTTFRRLAPSSRRGNLHHLQVYENGNSCRNVVDSRQRPKKYLPVCSRALLRALMITGKDLLAVMFCLNLAHLYIILGG
jgi:hypothetical protein